MSLVVAAIFFVEQCAMGSPPGQPRNKTYDNPPLLSMMISNPSQISIPLNHVSLREIHQGHNGKLIIHFEDAHSNYSGQLNLAKALKYFMHRRYSDLVLVEGSAKNVTLDAVRDIASENIWAKDAKRLLRESVISGEEYLNLTEAALPMTLHGVEYQNLYVDGLNAYKRLVKGRVKALTYLRMMREANRILKAQHYPKELLEYERIDGDHNSESKELRKLRLLGSLYKKEDGVFKRMYPHAWRMRQARKLEGGIDFDRLNEERSVILSEVSQMPSVDEYERMNRMHAHSQDQYQLTLELLDLAEQVGISRGAIKESYLYLEYLQLMTEINMDSVLSEMESLEESVYSQLLFGNPYADMIRKIDVYVELFKKAYNVQLTSKEFQVLESHQFNGEDKLVQGFVNKRLSELNRFEDLIPYQTTLTAGLSNIMDFYNNVKHRDGAFLENSKRIMQRNNVDIAYMIAGGYHTSNLTALLRKEGYSYIVLTPQVESETVKSRYEELLLSGDLDRETSTIRLESIANSALSSQRFFDVQQWVSFDSRMAADIARRSARVNEWNDYFRDAASQTIYRALNVSRSLDSSPRMADADNDGEKGLRPPFHEGFRSIVAQEWDRPFWFMISMLALSKANFEFIPFLSNTQATGLLAIPITYFTLAPLIRAVAHYIGPHGFFRYRIKVKLWKDDMRLQLKNAFQDVSLYSRFLKMASTSIADSSYEDLDAAGVPDESVPNFDILRITSDEFNLSFVDYDFYAEDLVKLVVYVEKFISKLDSSLQNTNYFYDSTHQFQVIQVLSGLRSRLIEMSQLLEEVRLHPQWDEKYRIKYRNADTEITMDEEKIYQLITGMKKWARSIRFMNRRLKKFYDANVDSEGNNLRANIYFEYMNLLGEIQKLNVLSQTTYEDRSALEAEFKKNWEVEDYSALVHDKDDLAAIVNPKKEEIPPHFDSRDLAEWASIHDTSFKIFEYLMNNHGVTPVLYDLMLHLRLTGNYLSASRPHRKKRDRERHDKNVKRLLNDLQTIVLIIREKYDRLDTDFFEENFSVYAAEDVIEIDSAVRNAVNDIQVIVDMVEQLNARMSQETSYESDLGQWLGDERELVALKPSHNTNSTLIQTPNTVDDQKKSIAMVSLPGGGSYQRYAFEELSSFGDREFESVNDLKVALRESNNVKRHHIKDANKVMSDSEVLAHNLGMTERQYMRYVQSILNLEEDVTLVFGISEGILNHNPRMATHVEALRTGLGQMSKHRLRLQFEIGKSAQSIANLAKALPTGHQSNMVVIALEEELRNLEPARLAQLKGQLIAVAKAQTKLSLPLLVMGFLSLYTQVEPKDMDAARKWSLESMTARPLFNQRIPAEAVLEMRASSGTIQILEQKIFPHWLQSMSHFLDFTRRIMGRLQAQISA